MSGNFDPITLIFIVLAVVIALRLRGLLGRRKDDDDSGPMEGYGPPGHKRQEQEAVGADPNDNVVTLPTGRNYDEIEAEAEEEAPLDIKEIIDRHAPDGGALAQGLMDIHEADGSFDPDSFLEGARAAYEMIVIAFADGSRKQLKPLLARDVYAGFTSVIDEREKQHLFVDSSFIGIDKAVVIGAELRDGRKARVTARHRQICQLADNVNGEQGWRSG